MNIEVSIDVEDEVRLALKDYVTVCVRPLPEDFLTPCVLVEQMGGTSSNTIDNFVIRLGARAATDAEALQLLRVALGVLEAQTKAQFGKLRYSITNSLASWGSDPVRPDLKLCTATVQAYAHKEPLTIPES